MVAIRHWDAEKLLADAPKHIKFYLFFGADAGLVAERLRNVVKGFIPDIHDAFQLVRLEGDELASDTGRLADEVNTIGLFGGRRAIWVRAGSRNLVPSFEAIIDSNPPDTLVVVEAGALKKDSALRKLFERERSAAAIECAHDSPAELRALIEADARSLGLAINRETVSLLVHSLGADRLTTRAELSKLFLYAHGKGVVTEADIAAIIADASALNLDAAINAAFGGQMALVDQTVANALSAGTDAGYLVGMGARHASMLHRARLDFETGGARDAAIEKASRRAFIFTRRETLIAQFETWSTANLARAIDVMGRALQECRKDARLAETIATRAFWSVASFARRGARS